MDAEDNLFGSARNIVDICCNKEECRIKWFDGFIPINFECFANEEVVSLDATPECFKGDVNVSMLRLRLPEEDPAEFPDMFVNLRKITHADLRKRAGIFSMHPYSLTRFSVREDKTWVDRVWLEIDPKKPQACKVLDPTNIKTERWFRERFEDSAKCMMGVQFWMENCSSVKLYPDDAVIGMTIPLPTLSMARDLFKLRDIEPGRKRRSALKHWVHAHHRQNKTSPEERTEIASYLRGTTNFDWNGMHGTITVR